MSSLKTRTVHAIKWSYFSLFTGIGLQLVFSAVLSRLLTKEQFGVVIIAFTLQRFGQFIADLGIGQAIVQKAELSEDDIRAGLTSSLLLGALASVLGWLLAPLAGRYFNNPELVPIFRGYACIYVLNSGIIISSSLLRRALRFRPLVISELSSFIIGHGVLGLGAAYLGYGAFSLVISAIAQSLIQLVILYAATRHTLRPIFRWSAYQGLYVFGTRATVVSFLEYISSSLDTFMLTKFYGAVAQGLYGRTYSTLAAPAMNFASSLTRVLAPSFSALQNEQERLRGAYLSGLRSLSLIIFSAAGCIVVDAPEIVQVMLGPQFADAVPLMQIFALYIPFAVLTNLSGVLAEATARLNAKIVIQSVHFVLLLAAFWITYSLGGKVEHIAAVLVVATMLRSVAFAFLARNIIGSGGREIAGTYGLGLLFGVGAALLSAAAVLPLRTLALPLPVMFITQVLLGGLLLAGVILLGPPSELQRMARSALARLWSRRAHAAD